MADMGIIVIDVRRSATGLWTATSQALEGVYVAHRDLQQIIDDMPAIVQRWFKTRKNTDVRVFKGPLEVVDGETRIPTIPVPAEIAAQAFAR